MLEEPKKIKMVENKKSVVVLKKIGLTKKKMMFAMLR